MIGYGPWGVPGPHSSVASGEAQIYWQGRFGESNLAEAAGLINSDVVDSGNTPTTTLRGGLVMAVKSSAAADGGTMIVYDPDATPVADTTGGSRIPGGVLPQWIRMLDNTGTAADRMASIIKTGLIRRDALTGLDKHAEAVFTRHGMVFDDAGPNGAAMLVHPLSTYEEDSTSYTVTAADNGKMLVGNNAAAVTFTLPTIAHGLSYEIMNYGAGGTVIDGASNLVVNGSITVDNLTLDSIGDRVRIRAAYLGATPTLKWIVEDLGGSGGVAKLPDGHAAGAVGTGGSCATYRSIRGNDIVTEIHMDITGLSSVATANDVIGAAGSAAYIGTYTEAAYGKVYKVEIICLELPTTGDDDINVVFNSSAALELDGAGGTNFGVNSGVLVAGTTAVGLAQTVTEADSIYLTAGAGDTAGAYDAGKIIVRIHGLKINAT